MNIGLDESGKRRRVSRSFPMPERKRIPKVVLEEEAKLRTEVKEGQHRAPGMTVAALLDNWMAQAESKLSPLTVVNYEKSIRLYLKPAIGKVKITDLTVGQVERLYGKLEASGGLDGAPLSPTTVRLAHAALRRALHHAMRNEWVTRNVAALAESPSVEKAVTRTPTPDEITALIDRAEPDLADLIALTAGLGLRRGEACAVRWSDIHSGHVLIERSAIELSHKVTVKSPKSGKARQVPIGPGLSARLKARRVRMAERALSFGASLSEDSYVLSDEVDGSLPLHPNLASDRFRRHARKEGIPVRLHDLRHAKATYALAAGVPATDVANAMGWASTKMLFDTYGHHTAMHDDALGAVNDF